MSVRVSRKTDMESGNGSDQWKIVDEEYHVNNYTGYALQHDDSL